MAAPATTSAIAAETYIPGIAFASPHPGLANPGNITVGTLAFLEQLRFSKKLVNFLNVM